MYSVIVAHALSLICQVLNLVIFKTFVKLKTVPNFPLYGSVLSYQLTSFYSPMILFGIILFVVHAVAHIHAYMHACWNLQQH